MKAQSLNHEKVIETFLSCGGSRKTLSGSVFIYRIREEREAFEEYTLLCYTLS